MAKKYGIRVTTYYQQGTCYPVKDHWLVPMLGGDGHYTWGDSDWDPIEFDSLDEAKEYMRKFVDPLTGHTQCLAHGQYASDDYKARYMYKR